MTGGATPQWMEHQPRVQMPSLDRQGRESGHAELHGREETTVDIESGLKSPKSVHEVRVFGLKLDGLPPWAKYLSLAVMVFFLSLSAAYCAELVFIKAGNHDICM